MDKRVIKLGIKKFFEDYENMFSKKKHKFAQSINQQKI
jgi:hypothetical protein